MLPSNILIRYFINYQVSFYNIFLIALLRIFFAKVLLPYLSIYGDRIKHV